MKYLIYFIGFIFLGASALNAQRIEPFSWTESTGDDQQDMSMFVDIYVDSVGRDFSDLTEVDFIPLEEAFKKIHHNSLRKYVFYFRTSIANTTSDTLKILMFAPRADKIRLKVGNKQKIAGYFSSAGRRDERFMHNAFHLEIMPNEALSLTGHFEYLNLRGNKFSKGFYLQKTDSANSAFFERISGGVDYKFVLISVGFLMAVCFMFLFIISQYVQTWDKLYLSYAIYLFTVIAYTFINFETLINVSFSFGDFRNFNFFKHPLGIFINAAYFYFISRFLDLKKHIPKLYRGFSWLILLLYVYIVIGIVIGPILGNYALERNTYFIVRFLWFIPSVYFLIRIWQKKVPYGRIVLIGTIILLVGSIISLILSVKPMIDGFWDIPIIYTQFSILIEIIFFSLGVGRKSRDLEKERLENKEELIQQLIKNERLQSDVNLQLLEKVKMHEIESEKNALAFEKEKAILKSTSLEKELAEMELLALRSQMNPHFIFNSLNSIKSYILRNGALEAAEYLTSFSNLIRSILQNSKNAQISLKEEIETALLYINLEQMRFSDSFDFFYTHASNVSLETIKVPPLILQPYIENAIWHGLLHLETAGSLKIDVVEDANNCVNVIIEDNGIGRKKSNLLKSKGNRNYQSMGMGITQDRINLHNQIHARGISVQVFDVTDQLNTGTKVIVKVKCNIFNPKN